MTESQENSTGLDVPPPSISDFPTVSLVEDAEEIHLSDAYAGVILNTTLIGCVLLAYYVKKNKLYFLPESAIAMLVGVVCGGLSRAFISDLTLYEFSPELFFFILLPPIIFEAGYNLKKKHFFNNIGAITAFAMFGTIISTFVVGELTFYAAKMGLVTGISDTNPMEALLFGALISAVDPVATLSIMGNPELQCNPLLYSLVFGESVLNDAISIVLFKNFRRYYDPESPNFSRENIPFALAGFFSMTIFSIIVGVLLGMVTSFIYKNTTIRQFPKLESTLLFLFCYFCYATAEAINLSGIMALFFFSIILSHYNVYNLSEDSRNTTEQVFGTLANVAETICFLYMGMGVFTGKYSHWNVSFTLLAMCFCVLGRALNIFPLSWISNLCRKKSSSPAITCKMQIVLWFAGLRGAIAYALSENMPGPNRDTYVTATLSICFFTTVVCGGCTDSILSRYGMKNEGKADVEISEEVLFISNDSSRIENDSNYKNLKGFWKYLDKHYLKAYFGSEDTMHFGSKVFSSESHHADDDLGNYELNIKVDKSNDDKGLSYKEQEYT